MKKIILGMLACCFILAASVSQSKAQVSVSLNVGNWTPPTEYEDVNYYYLPDVDSYYYVPTHQYIYQSGGRWVFRNSLPPRYGSYNINNGYKIAVNRERAYRYYDYDRRHYGRYRGASANQVIVRDNYRTRVINRPVRVVNRTRVINRPVRVVNHTRYVNRPARVVHRTRYVNRPARVVNRTRYVNRPGHARVVTHTRVASRPNGTRVVTRTRAVNRGHGHNKH
jgi:hypothetical protein